MAKARDLDCVVERELLDMGPPAMEERGKRPAHLVEIVFQRSGGDTASGGVKAGRHGALDLIWPGQGASIGSHNNGIDTPEILRCSNP